MSEYFNPRSHERSDKVAQQSCGAESWISIHAPTRGATIDAIDSLASLPISIHAPTRGATTRSRFQICASEFQSTLPREERQLRLDRSVHRQGFQSTLPREERRYLRRCRNQWRYFNPRSHERSDTIDVGPVNASEDFNPRSHERSDAANESLAQPVIFQSTLPREERQFLIEFGTSQSYFNPRSHERSDDELVSLIHSACISIHAPTRGATYPDSKRCAREYGISIHAPTRGATAFTAGRASGTKFQSTLPREERQRR